METNAVSVLDDPVTQLLLDGEASTASEAEHLYLERHLDEVVRSVESPLTDEEFRLHPLIQALFAHGSRGWEDSPR